MICSEEEAVGIKWCPFARIYVFSPPATAVTLEAIPQAQPTKAGGPANRYIDAAVIETNPESSRCLGSECMAWMWVTLKDENFEYREGCCGLAHGARVGEF